MDSVLPAVKEFDSYFRMLQDVVFCGLVAIAKC